MKRFVSISLLVMIGIGLLSFEVYARTISPKDIIGDYARDTVSEATRWFTHHCHIDAEHETERGGIIAAVCNLRTRVSALEGLRSIPGPIGSVGPEGPQGPRGERGESGLQGPQGERGLQGERGEPGSMGQRGDAGPRGEIGPIGPAGLNGVSGPRGERGERGEVGSAGPRGEQGLRGERGVSGQNIRMVDSSGRLVGYVLDFSANEGITKIYLPEFNVFTSVDLTRSAIVGPMTGSGPVFESTDCSGRAHATTGLAHEPILKYNLVHDTIRTPAGLTSSRYYVVDPTVEVRRGFTPRSWWYEDGSCVTRTLESSPLAIPLREIRLDYTAPFRIVME